MLETQGKNQNNGNAKRETSKKQQRESGWKGK